MDDDDLAKVHPELADPKWQREAAKRAKREHRRGRIRKRGNMIVSLIAVLGIAGVAGLMYQDGQFDGLLGTSASGTSAPAAPVNAFLGTQMANWPEGAAGFTAPPATQVGQHSPEKVAAFIERHPTTKMLALSFLLLIGAALIADGFHFHIPRAYLYFAMAFSAGVEAVNVIAMRNRRKAKSGEQK